MRITIELETSDGLVSPFENELVAYIAGKLHSDNAPVAETPSVEEEKPAPKRKRAKKKAEAPKEEAPKAEAPKAEAPKAEAPKAEAPKAEAPKEEEPKDRKEQLANATALASEMMQSGNVAVLKRILTTVGAKRVSTMSEEQTTRFIELAEAESNA